MLSLLSCCSLFFTNTKPIAKNTNQLIVEQKTHIVDSIQESYDCPLCLETFEPETYKQNFIMFYGCKHKICTECINLIKKNGKVMCSLCREMYYIDNVYCFREKDINTIINKTKCNSELAKIILQNNDYDILKAMEFIE